MEKSKTTEEPSDPRDSEGWRRVIAEGRLHDFRLEAVAAAFHALGATAERRVRDPLAKHLSTAITALARKLVGTNHPNRGEDIIMRVHGQLFTALCTPGSKDAQALQKGFFTIVAFRVKDAIATEYRHSRIPMTGGKGAHLRYEAPELLPQAQSPHPQTNAAGTPRAAMVAGDEEAPLSGQVDLGRADTAAGDDGFDDDDAFTASGSVNSTLLAGVRELEDDFDISRIVDAIPDWPKRLAFRLHMDGVPCRSTRGPSIAQTLQISNKTAEKWVNDARTLLSTRADVRALRQAQTGGRR